MKEIVKHIFGEEVANDPEIVKFYEEVQDLEMKEIISLLKKSRDQLILCRLIDKSDQTNKIVNEVDDYMGW